MRKYIKTHFIVKRFLRRTTVNFDISGHFGRNEQTQEFFSWNISQVGYSSVWYHTQYYWRKKSVIKGCNSTDWFLESNKYKGNVKRRALVASYNNLYLRIEESLCTTQTLQWFLIVWATLNKLASYKLRLLKLFLNVFM